MQDEKMEVICFETCGPHCDNVHVKMFLSEGLNVVNERIPT